MAIKELVDERASLHSKMTAILNKARTENRSMSSEEDQQFESWDKEVIAKDEEIAKEQKYEAFQAKMNALQPIQMDKVGVLSTKVDAKKAQDEAYSSAFYKMLGRGVSALSGEEQRVLNGGLVDDPQAALSPATGSTGGFIVPQGFEDQLEEARKWFGGIDQFADTINTDTGNPLPWPTANDTQNTGEIIGVNTQLSMAQPSFGSVLLNAFIFSSKIVLVPLALLQDSAFDLNMWLPKQLGMRIARIENNKFTVGVGGGTEPTGIVTAAAAAGNILTLPAGNTASISANNFVDLESKVDKAYRQGSKYMMNDLTLQAVKKLVDSNGRNLWLPGLASTLQGGYPNTINGYEYVINNDMPMLGAGNYPVVFGDYTAFKIRRVKGYTAMRLTERFADYLQVGFLAAERADSNLIDAGTHPVALLQNSAT